MSKGDKLEIQKYTPPFPYAQEKYHPQIFYHHSGTLGGAASS
jgi:hypothetical protein